MKAVKYAIINSIKTPINVHFLPISFNRTENVETHGKYNKQKTKNDTTALLLAKYTADVDRIIDD